MWSHADSRALLVLIHGFGEHAARYLPVAQALAEAGIAVAAPDLIGHGTSAGRRGDVGDVVQCAREIGLLTDQVFRPHTGHSRYVVFGHSFGGLVAITLALQHPEGLSRLIIQSPLLEFGFPIPRWKTILAMALARCWPTCPLLMNLDARWLSRDPAIGQAYRQDPLVHNTMSARSYRSILQARDDAFEHASIIEVPTLLLCGGADRIISVEAARRWCERLRCEKRYVEFPGAYHELHHETVRDEALQLVREWTLGREGRGS